MATLEMYSSIYSAEAENLALKIMLLVKICIGG